MLLIIITQTFSFLLLPKQSIVSGKIGFMLVGLNSFKLSFKLAKCCMFIL
ncbi:hypothetical protein GLYMA_19G122933v4 [Glycine max]|nr:hypothetical protein GLYMA_19G122933v4 [Glycine max]KAH1077497.1 hypothetical protein GYH30_052837 [Glycine max]